jgi:hypothetical protein
VPPGAPAAADEARRGQGAACVGCHEPEYRNVLNWWLAGSSARERVVRAYVTRAQNELTGAPDTARALLANAQSMLALVRAAGGQHNLELADRIFRHSITHAENAYRLAGRRAPPEPELGNTATVGTCTFCHYSGTDRLNYSSVSGELHERLIKTRR